MRFYIFIFLFLILFACNQTTNKIEEAQEIAENVKTLPSLLEFDLEKVNQNGGLATTEIINIAYDPVFKRAKKYEAIPLKPYLKQLIQSEKLNPTNTEIILLCKDGYSPSMSLEKVMNNEPFLAIKDLEAPEGKNWMDTLQGLWTPFYLIWTDQPKGIRGFSWSYGLKSIQFKASDKAYKDAFPKDNTEMIVGFKLFKSRCMKCHSVNKVGGIMGPEFNIPKNITEYWKKQDIMAFVKNPYSYRYNSKMPPVKGITDTELEQIISYLEYMKERKIDME